MVVLKVKLASFLTFAKAMKTTRATNPPPPIAMFTARQSTARAGDRRFQLLSALCAHTKPP